MWKSSIYSTERSFPKDNVPPFEYIAIFNMHRTYIFLIIVATCIGELQICKYIIYKMNVREIIHTYQNAIRYSITETIASRYECHFISLYTLRYSRMTYNK